MLLSGLFPDTLDHIGGGSILDITSRGYWCSPGGRKRRTLKAAIDLRLNICRSIDSPGLKTMLLSLKPNGLCFGARDLHGALCQLFLHGYLKSMSSIAGNRLSLVNVSLRDVVRRAPVRFLIKNCGLPDTLLKKLSYQSNIATGIPL